VPSVGIFGWMMLFLDLVVIGCVERERLGFSLVGEGEAELRVSGEEEGIWVIFGVGDGSVCGFGFKSWIRLEVGARLDVLSDRVGGVLLLTRV
jgi:hypothetical protein